MENRNPVLARPANSPSLEAAEAWKRRDYQKTIDILKQAIQQQPNNAKLLLNLGKAYGLRFDYEEAARCLEQAIATASNKAEMLAEAGRRCHDFEQPEMGHRYFSRAAEHPGVSPSVFVAMAEFEEGRSRREAALSLVERALEAQPDCPEALLARARLHRHAGTLEPGEKLLRALLPAASGETAIKAWYELGTNLDRQGRYDDAMEAFQQAKAGHNPSSRDHQAALKNIHAEIRKMDATVSASLLERWRATGTELQPTRRFALLCGHPRSGTTLLEQVLDAHPDVVATDETSILLDEAYPILSRNFAEDASMVEVLESASLEALRLARADYFRFTESFIGQTIGNRLLVDKNPALDVHIPLVVRIFPEAAFLVAIRDPRDVCLSCFMLPMPPGRLGALYSTLADTAAQYAWVMGISRAIRSRLTGPQLEIRYEDVVENLQRASRRVLEFLGLKWHPAVLRFDDHAKTRLLRCAIDEAVARPIFKSSVGRWRNYQKYLEPSLEQLEPFVAAFGYS